MTYLKATWGFMKALFRPSLQPQGYSPNGHVILKDWKQSPDEAILARAAKLQKKPAQPPRIALFCYDGPHSGDVIEFRRSLETIGTDVNSTLVITPQKASKQQKFRVLNNGKSLMMAQSGEYFRLNGVEEQKAELFDFDELEVMGNRCVVLDLSLLGKEAL